MIVTNPHIADFLDARARETPEWAIALALFKLASATEDLVVQVKNLGNGDASTPMGAIEGLAAHIGEKLDTIASVLDRPTNG